MRIYYGLPGNSCSTGADNDGQHGCSANSTGRGVALGYFDGVHKGHRKLLRTLVKECRARKLIPAVYTFANHPSTVLGSGEVQKLLSTNEEKAALMEAEGIEELYFDTFDMNFAKQSPAEFVHRVLKEGLGAKLAVAGTNYTFGSRGSGNSRRLRTLCGKEGIDTVIVAKVRTGNTGAFAGNTGKSGEIGGKSAGNTGKSGEIGGKSAGNTGKSAVTVAVSSTFIREQLAEGRVEAFKRLTGRRFAVEGIVRGGREVGRKMGFPTANLAPDPALQMPAVGVYATDAVLEDGRRYMGITNIGDAPTFEGTRQITVETNLLDFDGDLYGQQLRVEFIGRMRDQQKFRDAEALRQQLLKDIDARRQGKYPEIKEKD